MTLLNRKIFLVICTSLMASCATVHPTNFYTLSQPLAPITNNDDNRPSMINANMIDIAVNVPDGLKRPQIVIHHQADARLIVLEHERWLSAFDEELQDALTSGIHAHSNHENLIAKNRYRIAVNLLQMDTYIDNKVRADFHWQIKRLSASSKDSPDVLNCQLSASKSIDSGVKNAVAGVQAIVQDLINVISQQLKKMESGPVQDCN